MRDLNMQEAMLVAGGNDTLNARVADACEGQPDSTNVTVTYTSSRGASAFGLFGGDAHTSLSMITNCGDYRENLELNSGSEDGA